MLSMVLHNVTCLSKNPPTEIATADHATQGGLSLDHAALTEFLSEGHLENNMGPEFISQLQ